MALIEEDLVQEEGELQPVLTAPSTHPETRDPWRGMSSRLAFVFGLITAIAIANTLALLFVGNLLLRGSR